MQITIRNIGNSKGVVLPKPLLEQAGLDEESVADLIFENGAIVLRKPVKLLRAGWADAASALASQGADSLLLSEFGVADGAGLAW